jgi:tetratricopeptide (TPR) repeat protein
VNSIRLTSFRIVLLLTAFLFAIAVNFNCTEENRKESAGKYASLDTATKYLGMNTCRECHTDIYDRFINTGMGKSFDKASKSKSSAKIDNHSLVYDASHDFYYQPFWENDSLRIREFRLEGKDTIHLRVETVSYIVGSGQHTNSHIMNTGGYLNQMPLTFYTQKGKWDLPPGFENGGNSRFSRLIGLECMTCHNSYPKHVAESENKYESVQHGINCERCHGPGSVHVEQKKRNQFVDISTQVDYTIVNPAKLPISLQLDVCQRCHIQGNAVLNEGKTFLDFKPGMALSDVMNVFMPVYEGRDTEHIMASHVERLKLSPCFIISTARAEKHTNGGLTPYKNAITCVTCHNPHVSVKETAAANFNNACKNCHQPGKDKLCTEEKEKLHLASNNCVSCHMPQSGATDIPHVSVHDHFIRVPVTDVETAEIKRFIGINCINNPAASAEAKGKAFIAYYEKFNFGSEMLDSAKKYFPASNENEINRNFRQLIHLLFLEKNYSRVSEIVNTVPGIKSKLNSHSNDNTDAWTAYRIGESFSQLGNTKMAGDYYSIAYTLAGEHPDFANKYANSLASNGDPKKAMYILDESVNRYSKFAPTLSNLGYLKLLVNRDTSASRILFDKAIALDPDYDQAVINKAGLLVATNNKKDALILLQKFSQRHPKNIKVKDLINQLKNI